jgi:hypothetical protein
MLHDVPANERQVGGSHYKVAGRVEHWDLVERYGLGYLEGCATKYIARHREKGGRQDLEKSLHYIEKLIELHSEHGRVPRGVVPARVVTEFTEGMGVHERGAINLLCRWDCLAHLEAAHKDVSDLLL